MKSSRRKLTVGAALATLVCLAITAYAATTVILGVGNAPHSDAIGGPATMTARTLSLAPGEVATWHYHPGPLFNIVTQGTVTVEDGCGGEQSYTVGQAFEEGGRVHRPKNLGGTPTFAYQMFVVPLGEPTTISIPQNQRMCGPVRDVEECANGGWQNFNFPQPFNNQGECVAFVQSKKNQQ